MLKLFVPILALFFIGNILGQRNVAGTRPDPEGIPTKVHIGLYIIDIESIDNIRQNFTADFVMVMKWVDPRISAPVGTRLKLKEVWNPDVILYNLREADMKMEEVVTVFPGDTIDYIQRYNGTFSTFLDFREFPFDKQILPITVVSFTYSPEDLVFAANRIGIEDRLSISGWDIKPIGEEIGTFDPQFVQGGGIKLSFPRFDYIFEASRHLNYYWWKVVAPLALIVFLSWAVFYIDPSQVGPQIGVSATSILTLIAFLLRLESILPPVSYLTQMDYFIYSALVLVFLAYVEALVSTTNALRGKKEFAKKIDLISRFVYPVLFLIIMLYFWIL